MRRRPLPVPEGAPGAAPVGGAAAMLVSGEVRRLARWRQRDAASLANAELHRVRIAAKRARYVLEFFAPVLAPDVQRVVRTLVRVQDTLGAHQDAVFAVGRLETLAKAMQEAGANLETLLALGGLRHAAAGRQTARHEEFSARAPRLWRRLRGLRARLASAPNA
jgi:CHAD domain-containing protein